MPDWDLLWRIRDNVVIIALLSARHMYVAELAIVLLRLAMHNVQGGLGTYLDG